MVAWGSWQAAQVWEVATGQEPLSFDAPRGEVMSVAFLPDGRRLVTGSTDATTVVWDLAACARGKGGSAKVTSADIEGLWTDLQGEDGGKSFRALWTLVTAPKEVMPLLRKQLKPAAEVDPRDWNASSTTLTPTTSRPARRRPRSWRSSATPRGRRLRKALDGTPSAEVKQRAELLLGKLRTAAASLENTRESRALELLERLDTPEATALLKELAAGEADARLTREAKAVLKRR